MADSKRGKGKSKPPSRQKYEKEHPTISFRLDKETHGRLMRHLDGTDCSFGDFVKDALGREESTIEKRIQAREGEQLKALKEKVRRLTHLVQQAHILIQLAGQGKGIGDPFCPICGEEMHLLEVKELGADPTEPKTYTHVCLCGYFIDTYKGIDPSSLERTEDDDGEDEEGT